MLLQGLYGIPKRLPTVPGWEGAGTVIASGGGILANWLKGKRVACGSQSDTDGTWAEYCIASAKTCIPLRREISLEQGACLMVNPLTAWALLDTAKRGRHRGIIQTAAASQLGRIIVRMAGDAGLPLINVVRSKHEADILNDLAADFVLNSGSDDFEDQLRELCHKLNATIFFDAVAGPLAGKVFNAMPQRSRLIVHGVLSYAPISGVDGEDLIFNQKRIRGFWLTDWARQAGFLNLLKASVQIQSAIAKGSIAIKVRKRIKFEEVPSGISEYLDQMSSGKLLIVPRKGLA
jgi:NADPH:quinone reductase-like Zn-dependent oxidoreductase